MRTKLLLTCLTLLILTACSFLASAAESLLQATDPSTTGATTGSSPPTSVGSGVLGTVVAIGLSLTGLGELTALKPVRRLLTLIAAMGKYRQVGTTTDS